MDAAVLEDLFSPFASVTVKRMFGGHGIYADGRFFALRARGAVYLKGGEQTQIAFREAGSRPLVYGRGAKPMTMAYWRLPEAAHEDANELIRWSRLAFDEEGAAL